MALNVYFRVIDNTTLAVMEEMRNQRYNSINYWINSQYTSHPQIRHIRDCKIIQHRNIDNNLTCYDWNINNCQVLPLQDGLEHLISRCIIDGTDFVCIDNCPHAGNQLVLFQDAIHLQHYPQQFVKVPCFTTYQDLITYAVERNIFSFSLAANTDFERTRLFEHGETVYKEKRTNHYWYWDNFHDYHYEVFDSRGHHLGEANLEGVLDTSKKDTTKRITI